jgi:hypothetical protein
MFRLSTVILLLLLAACDFQSDESNLQATISEMVALIDAGKDQKLISEYAYFDAGKSIPSEIPDKKREELRAVLVRAQELIPEFSENNTLAVYESALFDKPIWFIKQQGTWRIMNNEPNKAN